MKRILNIHNLIGKPNNPMIQVIEEDRKAISKKPKVTQTNRNTTIDLFKLLASIGVIALHVKVSTQAAETYNNFFWPLCVPYFYTTSLIYYIASSKKTTIQNQYSKIFIRIIVPYLAWTIIYMSLFLVKDFITGKSRDIELWRIIFYGESAVQLYFVPTLIFMQLLALSISLLYTDFEKNLTKGIALLITSLTYFVIGDIYNCFGSATTGQFLGLAIYLAFAFYLVSQQNNMINRPIYMLAGSFLTITAILCNFLGYRFEFMDYSLLLPISGIGLVLIAVCNPFRNVPEWLIKLSSASYGIYLCHVLFLEALEFGIEKYFSGIKYDFFFKTITISFIFFSSLLFIFFLRKSVLLKKLFLGEN